MRCFAANCATPGLWVVIERRTHFYFARRLAALALLIYTCVVVANGAEASVADRVGNGVRLIVERTPGSELVSIIFMFPSGAATERMEEYGQTNLMMRVQARGAGKLDADDIDDRLNALEASLKAGAVEDYAFIETTCPPDSLVGLLSLVETIISSSKFSGDECEKTRARIDAEKRLSLDDPKAFALDGIRADLFSGHPYGHDPRDLAEGVNDLLPGLLEMRHKDVCRIEDMIVSVVGDVDLPPLRRIIERWRSLDFQVTPRLRASKRIATRYRERVIERAVERATVVVGYVIPPSRHEDFPVVEVIASLLGTGDDPKGRLLDSADLPGGAQTVCREALDQGFLACYARVDPDDIERTRSTLHAEIGRLRDRAPDDREMADAKRRLVAQRRQSLESGLDRARRRAFDMLTGAGHDDIERYAQRVAAVSARDIPIVARKYFARPAILLVCPYRYREVDEETRAQQLLDLLENR